MHGHAGALGRARARADERVPGAQAAAELRVDALLEDSELAEPPEEVAPADPLRKRHLARSDREVGLAIRCELRGDLEAGVAAAHDEHRPVGELTGVAVADAVGLNDRRVEVGCEGGNARDLERPGCHDDLVGLNGCAVLKVKAEAAVLAPDGADLASELHGELEGLRVALEVGDHLVSAGIAVGVAGELEAGKAVVAPRREERERVPARSPRGADRVGGFEDDEAAALLCELVAHGQAGLAGADHCYVVTILSRHVLKVLGVVDCSPRPGRPRIPTGRDAECTLPVRWKPTVAPSGNAFWRATTRRARGSRPALKA